MVDSDSEPEYQVCCVNCGGLVYANRFAFFSLMLDDCDAKTDESDRVEMSDETIVALWDLTQEGDLLLLEAPFEREPPPLRLVASSSSIS